MSVEKSNSCKQVETVAHNIITTYERFAEIINVWHRTVCSNLKSIDKININNSKLCQELNAEQSSEDSLEQSQHNLTELETKLKDITEQEVALTTNLQNLEQKILKFKTTTLEQRQSKKNKIQILRDCTKMSKNFTGATFDHLSKNTSGFIVNKDNYQAFDLSPDMSKENITEHLWKCISMASGENHSSVLSTVK